MVVSSGGAEQVSKFHRHGGFEATEKVFYSSIPYQAQLFEEKFGSGALSDHQKHRRKMYEQAVQLDIHHEKEHDVHGRQWGFTWSHSFPVDWIMSCAEIA